MTRRSLASLFTLPAVWFLQTWVQAEKSCRAVSINHITVKVPDLQRTSNFYQEFFDMPLKQHSARTHILGVDDYFFGIEQGDGEAARVDHYDLGIAGFQPDDVREKLRKLNLKFESTDSKESFKVYDPDGFHVQVNPPDYLGHVG